MLDPAKRSQPTVHLGEQLVPNFLLTFTTGQMSSEAFAGLTEHVLRSPAAGQVGAMDILWGTVTRHRGDHECETI